MIIITFVYCLWLISRIIAKFCSSQYDSKMKLRFSSLIWNLRLWSKGQNWIKQLCIVPGRFNIFTDEIGICVVICIQNWLFLFYSFWTYMETDWQITLTETVGNVLFMRCLSVRGGLTVTCSYILVVSASGLPAYSIGMSVHPDCL